MSINHVFNENIAKLDKRQAELYKARVQTSISFQDQLGNNNGKIETEIDDSNRNNLYYTNEQGIIFPLNNSYQRFYEQMTNPVTIIFDDGEKSIFDTTDAIGRRSILPNITRIGSKYKLESHGTITTSSANQQLRIKTKLGNATIEEDLMTLPNLSVGSYYSIKIDLLVRQIGNAGEAHISTFGKFQFINNQGLTVSKFLDSENNTTYQTTSIADADITFEWLADGTNNLTVHELSVYMLN